MNIRFRSPSIVAVPAIALAAAFVAVLPSPEAAAQGYYGQPTRPSPWITNQPYATGRQINQQYNQQNQAWQLQQQRQFQQQQFQQQQFQQQQFQQQQQWQARQQQDADRLRMQSQIQAEQARINSQLNRLNNGQSSSYAPNIFQDPNRQRYDLQQRQGDLNQLNTQVNTMPSNSISPPPLPSYTPKY